MQLTEHVAYEIRDRIARVTLTRPEARNALTDAIAQGLVLAVAEIERDRKVRAVILSGEGPVFCAGGDLKSFASGSVRADFADTVHKGLLGLHRSPAPVVTAIQGAAIGYGLGLACACDIRLAGEGTKFQAGFTGIGLSPDSTTSYFLPRLFGLSVATRMMLTNLPMDAAEAQAHGFVASMHPAAELLTAAESLADRLAHMPSGALRRAKTLLQASLSHGAEEHVQMEVGFILESFATDDFREGVTAFVEKRKPEFEAERG
ncbi:MAG: enoyl-CoA hydratase/isomerase family protein [Candidatus Dormibacterales bacterium]